MKKVIYCLVAVVLVAGLVFGCAAPAPAPAPKPAPAPAPAPTPAPKPEPIVINYITRWAKDHSLMGGIPIFIEKVEELAPGEVEFKHRGGPESFPVAEMPYALMDGVVDMLGGVLQDFFAVSPEVSALSASMLTPMEERENGAYDFLAQIFKEKAAVYVGRVNFHDGFSIYLTKPISTPYDLPGRKLRSASTYEAFFKELGIVPVTIPFPALYSALDRGLVEGFGWSESGVVSAGWSEVAKYKIDHLIYQSNISIAMNRDFFNNLPSRLQDIFIEAAAKTERELAVHFAEITKEERQKMLDAGMEFVKFSPADAEWYVETAYRAKWAEILKTSPEYGPRLKEFFTK